MRPEAPFRRDDLEHLAGLYERASAVVAMEDVADGVTDPAMIAVRHDVDDNTGSFQTALAMAEWEHGRGYRTTYFLLHTAGYWNAPGFRDGVERMLELGHEVGLHLNAITEAIQTGRNPLGIVAEALAVLRSCGVTVRGVVGHGDQACYEHGFVNDELFTETPRPSYGEPNRMVGPLHLRPVSRSLFGLEYDAAWLHRGDYLSDSGGRWSQPFDDVAAAFPLRGQLHILQHPDWWGKAFVKEGVVA